MRIHPEDKKTGLVLPGGGARGAFQVGVLKALAEMLPPGCTNPFPVISGTSAGAINSVVLASKARRFRVAAAELERVWASPSWARSQSIPPERHADPSLGSAS